MGRSLGENEPSGHHAARTLLPKHRPSHLQRRGVLPRMELHTGRHQVRVEAHQRRAQSHTLLRRHRSGQILSQTHQLRIRSQRKMLRRMHLLLRPKQPVPAPQQKQTRRLHIHQPLQHTHHRMDIQLAGRLLRSTLRHLQENKTTALRNMVRRLPVPKQRQMRHVQHRLHVRDIDIA